VTAVQSSLQLQRLIALRALAGVGQVATGFKNGFKQLGDFRVKLKKPHEMLRTASRDMHEEVKGLIDEGFAKRRDPSGKKWARRKRRYPWPILNKTLALRKSWTGTSNQHGFGFRSSIFYSRFHQEGTRYMTDRKQVPERALPTKWRVRLRKVWLRTANRHFNG
jgi:hypothetical protein